MFRTKEAPAPATVITAADAARIRQQSVQRSESRAAYFNCDICGDRTPVGTDHRCAGLSSRQRRRLAAHRAEVAAAAEEKRRATVTCVDCRQQTTPGQGHACPGMVRDAAMEKAKAWQHQGMVTALKRAGFTQNPE